MSAYWITWSDGSQGCIETPPRQAPAIEGWKAANEADQAKAKAAAQALRPLLLVERVEHLPYPASPRLGDVSDCPSFCFSPRQCAGHSSCTRSISCVD